jgi:hypothetical protein
VPLFDPAWVIAYLTIRALAALPKAMVTAAIALTAVWSRDCHRRARARKVLRLLQTSEGRARDQAVRRRPKR